MNKKAYTQTSGELDGFPGNCIFSEDGFYLGFVFDDPARGIKCHNGVILKREGPLKTKDPADYLAENIEPDRSESNHIKNFIIQTV